MYGHANADIDVRAGDPHKLLLTRARKQYHVNPDGNGTVVFGDHHVHGPRGIGSYTQATVVTRESPSPCQRRVAGAHHLPDGALTRGRALR